MSNMQETATIHHKTITKLSRGEVEKLVKTNTRGRSKNGPVKHLKVAPMLWEVVKEIMSQDKTYTTVEIIDWDQVVIR